MCNFQWRYLPGRKMICILLLFGSLFSCVPWEWGMAALVVRILSCSLINFHAFKVLARSSVILYIRSKAASLLNVICFFFSLVFSSELLSSMADSCSIVSVLHGCHQIGHGYDWSIQASAFFRNPEEFSQGKISYWKINGRFGLVLVILSIILVGWWCDPTSRVSVCIVQKGAGCTDNFLM